jgi:DNA polymerase-4
MIWGVGKALGARLQADGIHSIGDLLPLGEQELVLRYGSMGHRLYRFARGEDSRHVEPDAPAKSVSAETTFNEDLSERAALEAELWPLAEAVSRRLKKGELAARSVVLKLKTADFRLLTRRRRLTDPTQLAAVLYEAALLLLAAETNGQRFRLSGIGTDDLVAGALADPPDLLNERRQRQQAVERAIDEVRERMGREAIRMGRAARAKGRVREER